MRKVMLVVMVMCLVLSACQTSDNGEKNKKEITKISQAKVGFSQMEINSPWRVAETNSLIEEAKKRNVEFIYRDAKGSVEQQLKDVRYLLDQGIDYLLLAPKTYEEMGEALRMAKSYDVEVILIDRSCKGVAGEDYLTLINSDHIWESEQAGLLLADATNLNAKIVELAGTEGSSSAMERAKGFRNIINQHEGMEIIVTESADFFRAEGKRVMESIIKKHKGEMSAVYAHNDEMAIGAIMALKAAGIEPGEDVIVISVDGEKDALKAIVAEDLYATIECTPYFGPLSFDLIQMHIHNEPILPQYTNVDRVFTIKNAAQHIDEAF